MSRVPLFVGQSIVKNAERSVVTEPAWQTRRKRRDSRCKSRFALALISLLRAFWCLPHRLSGYFEFKQPSTIVCYILYLFLLVR